MDHELLLHDRVPGEDLAYICDFGDNWWHDVRVINSPAAPADLPLPCCVDGAPQPDDVGGIGGYHHALEMLQNPAADDHEYFVEWFGEQFDPTAFDPAEVNARLPRRT